ncbi:MAG: extracellular solute-binding protein [Lachnospiraceae bacterium]|nr:extracellular solute-binding protein [Lachnospiraceae bacterium]
MSKNAKKVVITLAVIAAFVVLCVLLSLRKVDDFSDKYAGQDLTKEVAGMERTGTYSGYMNAHADAKDSTQTVDVDLFNYTSEGNVTVESDVEGIDKALFTDNEARVTWKVNIPEDGFYNIYIEYLIPKSRGVQAERGVYINGECPYEIARNITFSRIWTDGGPKKIDNQGNEIRPTQVEVFDWQSAYLRDDMGYVIEPLKFYFEKGENELTFESQNEPMYLKKVSVAAVCVEPTYEEYITANSGKSTGGAAGDFLEIVQGEDSTIRSESSLYAKFDRSSPTTQPNSVTYTVLNYVGGETWRDNGQWIEWEFEVPADGYYNIMLKARQNYSRGNVSNRRIYIDGEVPFKELNEVSFSYKNDWECKDLADEDGIPYNFYLTKGKHTIRLEATLGGLGAILEELENSTFRLNNVYRKLLVYTGANPDQYRDYKININYPEIMEAMKLESMRLFKTVDDMVAYSGQKADQIASAQTVAQQLERFCRKPQKITLEFTTFKDNVTALGTAQLNLSLSRLDIDYIAISGTNVQPKKEKANFFTKAWHEIKSFAASFYVDYNSVGDVYDEKAKDTKVIKVWVLTGRDQGTILKSMIDDSFTPNTGVPVNVEIVDQGALLSAVMAGRGPNVVLTVGSNLPVDFALRGASVDITQFEGWEEVLSHYQESSYEQFRLDGAIYGVPETQTFNVMFYRKDVLEELGLTPPNTWQELIEMLPTIQGNNLSVGIPSASGSSSTTAASTSVMSNNPDLSMYFSLLYQNGGDMYNEAGTYTTVDDEAGIKAFDDYERYFNDYGLPAIYDFVSRFRSGEMPIGIASYQTYNTLMVSAPEIRGLWDFTLIPGTEYTLEDGSTYIDRSDFVAGTATMMIDCHDGKKNESWEFMKWWADPDTQVRFGREIEALLGSSARYATSNRDAFSQLSWSYHDIQILNAQWDWTVGIREVPGGYYTGRHITNALRKVINDKDDTRETIIDYSVKIDDEIMRKRKEFGMWTEEKPIGEMDE